MKNWSGINLLSESTSCRTFYESGPTVPPVSVFTPYRLPRVTNLAAWFVDGFHVVGFFDSVFGAIIVSIVSWLASSFIGPRGRYEIIVERR